MSKTPKGFFSAKAKIESLQQVEDTFIELRGHYLNEVVGQFIWEQIVICLANDYMHSKQLPKYRKIYKVVRDEINALMSGQYDEEFDVKDMT